MNFPYLVPSLLLLLQNSPKQKKSPIQNIVKRRKSFPQAFESKAKLLFQPTNVQFVAKVSSLALWLLNGVKEFVRPTILFFLEIEIFNSRIMISLIWGEAPSVPKTMIHIDFGV